MRNVPAHDKLYRLDERNSMDFHDLGLLWFPVYLVAAAREKEVVRAPDHGGKRIHAPKWNPFPCNQAGLFTKLALRRFKRLFARLDTPADDLE